MKLFPWCFQKPLGASPEKLQPNQKKGTCASKKNRIQNEESAHGSMRAIALLMQRTLTTVKDEPAAQANDPQKQTYTVFLESVTFLRALKISFRNVPLVKRGGHCLRQCMQAGRRYRTRAAPNTDQVSPVQ